MSPLLPLHTSPSLLPSFVRSFVAVLGTAVALSGCGQMLVTVVPGDSGMDAAPLDATADGSTPPDARPDALLPLPDASAPDASAPDASVVLADAALPDAFAPDAFTFPLDAFSRDAAAFDAAAAPDAAVADASMRDASEAGADVLADGGMPRGVELGAAGRFAVLAGSTVSSTGFSVITGDVGLTPGTEVIGFPPGVVIGTFHIANPTAAAAALALTDAFNDAAARTDPAPVSVSGNLGGRTLAPGIYVSGSSLEISAGDLTLDALGDANAVWIFQMPTSFTATSGRMVVLSGGARANNVYWQVGSSATLGSTSRMVGNFLVDQSITLETGAHLVGRTLTRIGAVTLDGAVIELPAP